MALHRGPYLHMKKIIRSWGSSFVLIIIYTTQFSCTNIISSSLEVSLIINECMVRNCVTTGIVDEEGRALDWIEMYNMSDDSIFLGDFFISDRLDEPMKGALPDIYLAPAAHVLLWGGQSNRSPINHLGFGFSTSNDKGEKIVLFDKEGSIIDSISYLQYDEAKKKGTSLGRITDGSTFWVMQRVPSPGYSNGE